MCVNVPLGAIVGGIGVEEIMEQFLALTFVLIELCYCPSVVIENVSVCSMAEELLSLAVCLWLGFLLILLLFFSGFPSLSGQQTLTI